MATAKIVSLAIRTLAKPISTTIKQRAQNHPRFKKFCINVAQTYHTIEENLKMRFFDAKVAPIRPLNEARAVELGANFMSESLLFGVAGLTIFLEAWRSSHKASTRVTTVDDTFERLSAERQQDAESLEALQAVVRDVRGELGEVQDAVKALTLAVSALAGGKGNDSAKGGTWLWGGGRSDDNEVARRMAEVNEAIERAERFRDALGSIDRSADGRSLSSVAANVVEAGLVHP